MPNIASETIAGSEPATGLRDRKKARQRADLLTIAVRLFRDRGYEKVRIEDIAAAANVATKTVYNYYPAKGDFLIEFLRADRSRAAARYEAVLRRTDLDVGDAVVSLMISDVGDLVSGGDRGLWLDVMSAAVKARADERFRKHRWDFTSVLEGLLKRYQATGEIAPALDVRLTSDVLHTLYTERFLEFCSDETLPDETLRADLRELVEFVLGGWRTARP